MTYHFEHFTMNFICTTFRIYHTKSFRFGSGDGQVSVAHGLVKRVTLDINAVGKAAVGGASGDPAQTLFDRKVKKKRQIRLQSAGRQSDDLVDGFARKATARALIGHGRVGITIGQNSFGFSEGRLDHRSNMLRTIGREDQEFSQGIDLLVDVQQGFAQTYSQRTAARFAGRQNNLAATAEFNR